jgi:hypothetical protein
MTPDVIKKILDEELYTGPGSAPGSAAIEGKDEAIKRITTLLAEELNPPSGNQTFSWLKEHNETLKKVHPDEPIFVLRAQDNTAPGIVLHWISRNMNSIPEAKLKEAMNTALAMQRYSNRKDPD